MTNYLKGEEIHRIEWLAYSPDLNCIEYVLDILRGRLTSFQTLPSTFQELHKAIHREYVAAGTPEQSNTHIRKSPY